MNRNMEKEASSTKKLPESELSPNEVTVEEIEKGKSDGKVAVQGKKVCIFLTSIYFQVYAIWLMSQVWFCCFRSAYSILRS